MRPRLLLALLLTAAGLTHAQTHKVAKPQQVLRAIGVYEWTGDLAKPAASRLIPVSLYIDSHFEDAGVYLARPVPFALETGNVYMLQTAGLDKSSLELSFARHFEATDAAGDSAYDDGWFGYGRVHTLAPPRPPKPLHASKTPVTLSSSKPDTANDDPDRPTMIRRNPSTSGSSSTTSASNPSTSSTDTASTDPDRPTMKRRDSTQADNSAPGAADPAADPDRPTMKRSTGSSSTDNSVPPDPSTPTTTHPSSTPSSSGSTTADSTPTTVPADSDRPTLKRHTAADSSKAAVNDLNYNSDALNNDPNRPELHRGRPTQSLTETELPRLTGRPVNIRQMVAVSDAANREPHSFTMTFDDAAQRADILAKMQTFARAQLAAYISPGTAAPKPHTTAPHTTTTQHTTTSTATHHTVTTKKPTGSTIPLLDEDLKAYQLSYAGDATYVYTAHTDGTGAQLRYVTIVAQMVGLGTGQLQPAIQSVTDATHLDRTPALQFIDAVDADASNRASLLFELRSQNSRQFALYRVIAAHADQIFVTGTTQ